MRFVACPLPGTLGVAGHATYPAAHQAEGDVFVVKTRVMGVEMR